jgi:hypothetical protein
LVFRRFSLTPDESQLSQVPSGQAFPRETTATIRIAPNEPDTVDALNQFAARLLAMLDDHDHARVELLL